MADRFLGKNHGWGMQQMSGANVYKGIVSGTSTNSTDMELRYTVAVGVTKEHLVEFLQELQDFILQSQALEVA